MDLTRDQRRQLDHQRARGGGAIEVVGRRLDGLAACLGERLDGDARVRGVELAFRGKPDDDVRDVDAGREAIGRVGGAGARVRALRDAMGGLQEAVDPGLGVGDESRGAPPRGAPSRPRTRARRAAGVRRPARLHRCAREMPSASARPRAVIASIVSLPRPRSLPLAPQPLIVALPQTWKPQTNPPSARAHSRRRRRRPRSRPTSRRCAFRPASAPPRAR